jgi:16S rRNA (uracil1498-N3)-methyltransferase
MADRYYVDQPLGQGPVTLDGPEAHHLVTVCRLRPGDAVRLFNGDGREYPAQVVTTARRSVSLNVGQGEIPARELPYRLEVAAPLPKGERATFLIEKLTELGVTAFTPLQTARSVVLPREAKLERMQRHVIEASKQCGRNALMRVQPLTSIGDLIRRADLPVRRFIAHPGGTAFPEGVGDVTVAVGPEGGFTDEEIREARESGWTVAGLGDRLLRIETAALVVAVLSGAYG